MRASRQLRPRAERAKKSWGALRVDSGRCHEWTVRQLLLVGRPRHDLARHLRRLHHPLSTCCLASRWKEDMAFLRSFYVADDIWRFA